MLSTWFEWVKKGLRKGKSRHGPGGRWRHVQPQLEPLEDRFMPTTIFVAGIADVLRPRYMAYQFENTLIPSYPPYGEVQPEESASMPFGRVSGFGRSSGGFDLGASKASP